MAKQVIRIPKIVATTVVPVGSLAADVIADVIAGKYHAGALGPSRLSESEEVLVAMLASKIETQAILAVANLMDEPKFLNFLKSKVQRLATKRFAVDRARVRTEPLLELVKRNPKIDWKTLRREALAAGILVDRGGNTYDYGTSGKKIKEASIPAKLTRLRKCLRIA